MRKQALQAATYSLALLAVSASWASTNFDKQFSVSSGELLIVDTSVGSVDVVGSDDTQVKIHAEIDGSRDLAEKFKISASHENGVVRISGERDPDWFLDLSRWFGNLRVKYTISVPHQFKLDIKTSGGNLDFRKLEGSVNAHTSGGNVRIEGIEGDVNVHTSGGSMQSEKTHGRLRLVTSGGTIVVRNAQGDSDLHTSGGNLHLEDIEGDLRAGTSGGNIDLNLLRASTVELRTSGGNINVSIPPTASITIDAHTSGGRVRSDLPVTVSGDMKPNKLSGAINGGGNNRLVAHTSGGNIFIGPSHPSSEIH